MQFSDVLDKYRKEKHSMRDMGTRFEELMAGYLMTDPLYVSQLKRVYLWNDFFARSEFGKTDVGIDLVAEAETGEYWAIQCKMYEEDHRVSKSDLDTFIASSGKSFTGIDGEKVRFAYRMVLASTDNWSDNAVKVIENQTIPVMRIGFRSLSEAEVDWKRIEEGIHGTGARKEKYRLLEHQAEALDRALAHYSVNTRGKMIMACGTGKTFTSLRIAEAMAGERREGGKTPCVLFLAPSIALVGQTLREWLAHTERTITPIAVCSDPSVSKRRVRLDDKTERIEDLGMPATTDPHKIVDKYNTSEDLTVIFSTYQSIDAIISAQKLQSDGKHIGLPDFDLIVCDEAHRTTGVKLDENESDFVKVHSDDNLRGKKRLYMTATPRLYGTKSKEKARESSVVICSMDDESMYGEEFYRINFSKAVESDLLTDYKVMVLTVKSDQLPLSVRNRWENKTDTEIDADVKLWGCLNAIAKKMAYDKTIEVNDPGPMQSVVSFTSTIRNSKLISERLNQLGKDENSPVSVSAEHIDGSMNSARRDELMTWLKDEREGHCKLLSNVRCLSEGVDVPSLDAIVFMNSRTSLIDIVQSVGRVMRRAEGKKYGYIIIPVVVSDYDDPEEALDNDEDFHTVWQVLRALRSHDDRLEAEINTLLFREKGSGSSKEKRIVVGPGPSVDPDDDPTLPGYPFGGQYTLDDFSEAIYARLVLKVGEREYLENWARDVAEIMPDLMAQLTRICKHEDQGYKQYRGAFKRYLKGLRSSVNDMVSETNAIEMLAQQVITKPIFERLFGSEGFTRQNSVSQAIDAMLEEIDAKNGLKEIDDRLRNFYESVDRTLSRVETRDGKQKVVKELYEKFYKNAFPKNQTIDGIVYTPSEIVDFIVRSADAVMKAEFDVGLGDIGVNILDPFSGTGTFITELLESGIIPEENLEHKYRTELFANEITLLAYYIAAVNIENTYAMLSGSEEYAPFDNILLTDTFNIEAICESKTEQTTLTKEEFFVRNKERIRREHEAPITVIIGNPPYGAIQRSANEDAKKRTYDDGIDKRIAETYLDDKWFEGKKGLVNSVYDNYVRAFRWATDRLGDENGVITFVTPSGWLDSGAFVGFRKTIEQEFSKIYVFNLRGNQLAADWRAEGEKVFGEGSRVGISITLLVRQKGLTGKAKVYYTQVEDFMRRQDKLKLLDTNVSFQEMLDRKSIKRLNVQDNGDWIVERNPVFQGLVPLAGDTHKKFEKHDEETMFVGYSSGFKTNRDAWAYNFSKLRLEGVKKKFVESFNEQFDVGKIDYNDNRVKWTSPLNYRFSNRHKGAKPLDLDLSTITKSLYRPFTKIWFDHDANFNNDIYVMPKLFPTPDTPNMLICVSGKGSREFSCLITNMLTDLELVSKSQCFPLYWYEDRSALRAKNKQPRLIDDGEDIIRHDGISDHALKIFQEKYGNPVTREDIFFYVYGYLHSPEYLEKFVIDLKFGLPRIGLVESSEDFRAFSEAGRQLADLHLNYEQAEAPQDLLYKGSAKIDDMLNDADLCKVDKMRLDPKKRQLIYNRHLTIENIPEEVFEYIVNRRSALEWIVDRYQVTTNKESGITNDPNDYAGGRYILELVLSVMGMSIKTMEIIKSLPSLNLAANKGLDD